MNPIGTGRTRCSTALVSGVFVALALSVPNIASAQNAWVDQVRTQLVDVALAAGLSDMELTHEPSTGRLGVKATTKKRLQLQENRRYEIVGVCDADCSDLDLQLTDENGGVIDTDTADDDQPVVGVTPAWTGVFYVTVSMASCTSSPCYYGLGIFGENVRSKSQY
jgi:hypothetical protein